MYFTIVKLRGWVAKPKTEKKLNRTELPKRCYFGFKLENLQKKSIFLHYPVPLP